MADLRDATERDLSAILEITNHAISHSDAIWLETPETPDQRRAWFLARKAAGYPVIVAVDGDDVLGFGSYGPFRAYEGYRRTIEHSVYVSDKARRRGIGAKILDALVDHAASAGYHVMLGAIAASNAPSIALHERNGFTAASPLPQVGLKQGRWLDLVFMYRILNPEDSCNGDAS